MSKFSQASLWKDLARALPDGLENSHKIRRAFDLAFKAHEGQFRAERDPNRSSIPYIAHPVGVAKLIASNWQSGETDCDQETVICVGLLHDALEDTSLEYTVIRKEISSNVADITEKLTKPEVVGEDKKERNRLFARQIREAGPCAIYVKICDALHNLSRPQGMPTKLLQKTIVKAEDHYAPMLAGTPFEHRMSGVLRNAIVKCRKSLLQRNIEESEFDPFDYGEIITHVSRMARSKFIENHDLIDIMGQIPGVVVLHVGEIDQVSATLADEFNDLPSALWDQAVTEARDGDFRLDSFFQSKKHKMPSGITDLMRIDLRFHFFEEATSAVLLAYDSPKVPSWFRFETVAALVNVANDSRYNHKMGNVLSVQELASKNNIELSVEEILSLDISETDLVKYSSQYALASAYLAKIQKVIESCLNDANTPNLISSNARIKSLSSAKAKWDRTPGSIFSEMEDFIGVRLVCLSVDDVARILAAIEETFGGKKLHSKLSMEVRDFRVEAIESVSGYRATHLAFRIDQGEHDTHFFGCEIQIRTALQDVWAQVSETVRYKKRVSRRISLERDLKGFSRWCQDAETQVSKLIPDI